MKLACNKLLIKLVPSLAIVTGFCASLWILAPAAAQTTSSPAAVSKAEFDVIEGVFHDGLGTYAEVLLANELISVGGVNQRPFDLEPSKKKMLDAINRLPPLHSARARFSREIASIDSAVKNGAAEILKTSGPARVLRVKHTPREYSGARAGDLRLEFEGGRVLPISVKTDKSHKVAVAEGQTPEIDSKWARRYFKVTETEFNQIVAELGYASVADLKSHYLNVARLVARVLIQRLGLQACKPEDFSKARVGNLEAAKYLFRQLLFFKKGSDQSRVIIFSRSDGSIEWESLLEGIEIEALTAGRISFLPSRPRNHPIASEFGIKIDGRTVVTFQVKHKRGAARGTTRQYEFSDITTRLMLPKRS